MKVDGSQVKSGHMIAEYVRHYMRYYGIRVFVDPFCGFANIYRELYKSRKKVDPEFVSRISDFNPFIIAVLERLWKGEDIPEEICDRERWRGVTKELNRRFRNGENIFESYDGYEDWEVGCHLILSTYHQNPSRGYIGDERYVKYLRELKGLISEVPPPDNLACCDFIDGTILTSPAMKMIYLDFPEPTRQNFYPFGMYFERDELFEYIEQLNNSDNVVIFSSKYFPDNGRYEILYEAGDQKLYIGKRWYVEDILHAASGKYTKYQRSATSISEKNRRRKRRKVSRSRRSRGRVRVEKKTEQLREQD